MTTFTQHESKRLVHKHQLFTIVVLGLLALYGNPTTNAFSPVTTSTGSRIMTRQKTDTGIRSPNTKSFHSSTELGAVTQDLDVIALVAGQENYGLAVVCVGEALWSFLQAPSFDHAKVLVPASAAAVVLAAVSGPMITSGDEASVATGLWIATAVSVALGASYVARMLAPFSPSPKEIPALGLLVAIAGFFSFSQNLVVDGFVTLPSLPSIKINLPF